jgi:hypothetical protein
MTTTRSQIRKPREDRSAMRRDARAQMRVLIAEETGRSPFDPSVIREARHRVARQLDADIRQALQDPLSVVVAALPTVHGDGRFGDRKVFIAALHDRVGREIRMSLVEFKRWLIDQHRQRNLVLARADLVAAMPYDMVRRSEAVADGATFHFVVDPPKSGP